MVHGRSRGGCEATRQPLLVTAESNTAEPTPTHSWPSRHPSVDSVIHLRHVESKRRGSKRFHNFNPLALQRRTQPKYNAFSTAVYGPVTRGACTHVGPLPVIRRRPPSLGGRRGIILCVRLWRDRTQRERCLLIASLICPVSGSSASSSSSSSSRSSSSSSTAVKSACTAVLSRRLFSLLPSRCALSSAANLSRSATCRWRGESPGALLDERSDAPDGGDHCGSSASPRLASRSPLRTAALPAAIGDISAGRVEPFVGIPSACAFLRLRRPDMGRESEARAAGGECATNALASEGRQRAVRGPTKEL